MTTVDVHLFHDFIGNKLDVINYLHNTTSKETAENIMKEGFIFEHYIENTADMISGVDMVELRYFFRQRSSYGKYTIIISISKDIVEEYFEKLRSGRFHFSEALSKKRPYLNSDEEYVYTFPEEYIKGYYNICTNEIVKNPIFNPYFKHPAFDENVRLLINDLL